MNDLSMFGTCRLPGCWNIYEQTSGPGRPRHYCSDEHRRDAHDMRRRTEARLAHLRDQARRDEHLLAALGGEAEQGMRAETWSRGDWMQTFTGRQFYPLAPRPEDIDPRDIAHALSMLCRYGGHTVRFYSVAEHCLLISRVVAPEHALWALLHDATEAYVGDMVRPLKLHMPEYRAVEDGVMRAIAVRFGLDSPAMPTKVKEADNRILLDERDALFNGTPAPWVVDDMEPLGVPISGHMPEEAEAMYLGRLEELMGEVAS